MIPIPASGKIRQGAYCAGRGDYYTEPQHLPAPQPKDPNYEDPVYAEVNITPPSPPPLPPPQETIDFDYLKAPTLPLPAVPPHLSTFATHARSGDYERHASKRSQLTLPKPFTYNNTTYAEPFNTGSPSSPDDISPTYAVTEKLSISNPRRNSKDAFSSNPLYKTDCQRTSAVPNLTKTHGFVAKAVAEYNKQDFRLPTANLEIKPRRTSLDISDKAAATGLNFSTQEKRMKVNPLYTAIEKNQTDSKLGHAIESKETIGNIKSRRSADTDSPSQSGRQFKTNPLYAKSVAEVEPLTAKKKTKHSFFKGDRTKH